MDYNREARYAMTAQPSTPQQESQQEICRMVDLDVNEPIDFVAPVTNLGG